MPHDTDWDDDYPNDHYTLVGGILMGVAAVLVVAVLWWVAR